MSVSLHPLEFTECLSDSPHFRNSLQSHEKELDSTSQQIKQLIKDIKDIVKASKSLKEAHKNLGENMKKLELAGIGVSMTEDERVIERSLHDFGKLILTVEEERERMLSQAYEQTIQPLEKFQKEHIGAVKQIKKNFDIKIAKFCQSQERALSLSTKSTKADFQEADAAMDTAERDFCKMSLKYVSQLQVVQERKKFLLVETLQGFMSDVWTFQHKVHDKHSELELLLQDLQPRIQRTRNIFDVMTKKTGSLLMKMTKTKKNEAIEESVEGVSLSGYVFLKKKKASGITWSKQYCTYEKNSSTLTLTPYDQTTGVEGRTESVVVEKAQRMPDSERRFCWKVLLEERPPLELQAPNERKLASWLQAISSTTELTPVAPLWPLNNAGFEFVKRLTTELEARGLNEPDLYKKRAGVESEVSRLMALGRTRRLPLDFNIWESHTLTSALKSYFRALPDPLLTRFLHDDFLAVAKCEPAAERVRRLHQIVRELPPDNSAMLRLMLTHLERVVARQNSNHMTPSNLASFFGPTLLWAEHVTVAAIYNTKFYNALVEVLLENVAAVFAPSPPASLPAPPSGNPGVQAPEISGNHFSSHGTPSTPATALDPSATSDTASDYLSGPFAAAAPPFNELDGSSKYKVLVEKLLKNEAVLTTPPPALLPAPPARNLGIQAPEIPGDPVSSHAPPSTPATTPGICGAPAAAVAPPFFAFEDFAGNDENTSLSECDPEPFLGRTSSGDGNGGCSPSSLAAATKRAVSIEDGHSKRQCIPEESHREDLPSGLGKCVDKK